MSKKYLIYLYIMVVTIVALFFSYRQKLIEETIDQQLSGSISFSGNIFSEQKVESGDIIETGMDYTGIINNNQNDFDLFMNMKKDGFLRTYNPPIQPSLDGSMNYVQKSDILNTYLKENNFYFRTSQNLEDGYLYIKLKKPIKSNEDIFIYFHDTNLNGFPISGKIRKDKNLILGSTKEFLYQLNSIPIKKYYDGKVLNYNRLEKELKQTKKLHFIGGYLTTSDENFIQEISIVGK